MEPLSIITVSAAVGGAAGKFVEKAWDSGEKWIQSYFQDHQENAKKQATENTMEFLDELAKKVKVLEESKQISKDKIAEAQDHPDFSALLQKALLSSAQTENKKKHVILARLVSERLKSKPESILSLGSKMACDAISYTTVDQLMVLGLAVNIYGIRPNPFPPQGVNENNYQNWLDMYIYQSLIPYQNIKVRAIDLTHLESLSCLKVNTFIGRDFSEMYQKDDLKYDFKLMKETGFRNKIQKLWDDAIQKVELTTVGQIIGVSVSDLITNKTTSFDGWE